jgi:hypothetical protein
MMLPDVNVLVYAHRPAAPGHARFEKWLQNLLESETAFGVADLVLSGFVRLVTHPGLFPDTTPTETALRFVEEVRGSPNCIVLQPGDRHWGIFTQLCRKVGAKGNLVPDAFLAALAMEAGAELVTTDRNFARFPGLCWRHPLDEA